MAEMLKDTPLNHEQLRYTTTLQHSGKALLTILNDILDISKIEAGKMELEPLAFSIDELIDECFAIFALRIQEKGLTAYGIIEHNVPAILKSDPTRLRQVLLNLMGNGLKFTEKGSLVIQVGVDPDNEEKLAFKVSDTGIGISTEQQAKLFEAFTQADASTTRKFGGTGLGLAISKRLVELLGGAISLKSEENKGTTFEFSIQDQFCTIDQGKENEEVSPLDASVSFSKVVYCGSDSLLKQFLVQTAKRLNLGFISVKRDALPTLQPTEKDVLVIADSEAAGWLDESSCLRFWSKVLIHTSVKTEAQEKTTLNQIQELPNPLTSVELLEALRQQQGEAEESPASQGLPQYTLQVAVAEDNTVNQMVIRSMLAKLGIHADMANNGVEVVDFVRRKPDHYDLILMDCEMPEMDGLQATSLINRLCEEKGLAPPIIIGLSAHALQDFQKKAIAGGMSAFLTKPIVKEELIAELDRRFSSRRTQQLP